VGMVTPLTQLSSTYLAFLRLADAVWKNRALVLGPVRCSRGLERFLKYNLRCVNDRAIHAC
jgi:hypothetical protein